MSLLELLVAGAVLDLAVTTVVVCWKPALERWEFRRSRRRVRRGVMAEVLADIERRRLQEIRVIGGQRGPDGPASAVRRLP